MKKGGGTPALLKHELYHFKLAEIYARKTRQRFSKMKTISVIEAKHVFDSLMTDHWSAQEKYDIETKHSIDTFYQNKWENQIDHDLNELKEHSNSIVIIKGN